MSLKSVWGLLAGTCLVLAGCGSSTHDLNMPDGGTPVDDSGVGKRKLTLLLTGAVGGYLEPCG